MTTWLESYRSFDEDTKAFVDVFSVLGFQEEFRKMSGCPMNLLQKLPTYLNLPPGRLEKIIEHLCAGKPLRYFDYDANKAVLQMHPEFMSQVREEIGHSERYAVAEMIVEDLLQ